MSDTYHIKKMTLLEIFPPAVLHWIKILSLFFIFAIFLFSFFNIISILLKGAFFAPTPKKSLKKIVDLTRIKSGDRAVDLGSGDGRLVIMLAKAGIQAHGYEINPPLVWIAKRNIKKAGLSGRAFSHWSNFWNLDLSGFNIVTVFGVPYMMKKLEEKLSKELHPGSKVISVRFTFPNWHYSKKDGNIYLYEKRY